MPELHQQIQAVTARIQKRSASTRAGYLAKVAYFKHHFPLRESLSCANLAHGVAGLPKSQQILLKTTRQTNIGIVSSYNDMLSAHAPYLHYPEQIKAAAAQCNASAQFAGGVPAMCDGITQGNPGMELSLFSRDVIAMATAIALSHHMFDAVLCLGICDKIVPGLLIGALQFGHLPTIFVPAGPMHSGLPNAEKSRIRELYALGKVDRAALLEAESAAYHGQGTCIFYGTANSNQMLMEIMGLHLPGASFIHPETDLRKALTKQAVHQVLHLAREKYVPIANVIDEKAIVNGMIGLLATGGSTNHTLHLVAIARAAGIMIDWDDFSELSKVIPLLACVYPNGQADVNHFHAAGGLPFLIHCLLQAGLLHEDVQTVIGSGLHHYAKEPKLLEGQLQWVPCVEQSLDTKVLVGVDQAFQPEGGVCLITGPLGRGVMKISAVRAEHHYVKAPALIFESQDALRQAFEKGDLERDFIAVLRFQGPHANGMPELHRLTPWLSTLQDKGYHVALVTDGRMSGASGKVPAVIHVTPEAAVGGALAKVKEGDMLVLDAKAGTLDVLVDEKQWASRPVQVNQHEAESQQGFGRELFTLFRQQVSSAEKGASVFFTAE